MDKPKTATVHLGQKEETNMIRKHNQNIKNSKRYNSYTVQKQNENNELFIQQLQFKKCNTKYLQ